MLRHYSECLGLTETILSAAELPEEAELEAALKRRAALLAQAAAGEARIETTSRNGRKYLAGLAGGELEEAGRCWRSWPAC
jgi:hypothetical protein